MSFLEKKIFRCLKEIKCLRVGFFLVLLVQLSNASAHHSHANLDRNKVIVNKGIVVKYGWSMPHDE